MESGAFKSPLIKNVPAILDCYVHFLSIKTNKIVKLLEYYGLTKFYPLVEKGEYLDTTSQSEPNNVFDFEEVEYKDKRIHGMDNKAFLI